MSTGELIRQSRLAALLQTGGARSIRVANGLSQADLAAHIGVSAAALSRWERAERAPRRALGMRYLDALETLTGRPVTR